MTSTSKTGANRTGGPDLGRIMQSLTPVSGKWGSGRLLNGKAFSAVITNDGRIAVGAVNPQSLFDALNK